MEEVRYWKQKNLISELNQGKEVATQLRNLLPPYSATEKEIFLIEKILSSFEEALSMINRGASMEQKNVIEEEPKHQNLCNKRKRSPQWNEQVKISAGEGLEGSLDDGHSWRKYGQKDILGASYPRGYYRCTHRHSQGCLATKQVQRSDEDRHIFQITYKGRHTCSQTPFPKEYAEEGKPEEGKPEVPQEFGFTAPAGEALQVKTEDVDCSNDRIFPSFAFSSSSHGSESMMENLFSGSLMPAISDSDYFNPDRFVLSYDLHISDSDLSDMISAPTSVTNSPMGQFEFSLGKIDIDPGFPFHELDFLSGT